MANVEVVSATTAFHEEKIDESNKAQDATAAELVTAAPAVLEAAPEEPKETETTVVSDGPAAPEVEGPVAEIKTEAVVEEAKVTPEEPVVEKTEEEVTPKVAPEPVVEDSTAAPVAPEPEPEAECEVTTEEEKPTEAEEKVGTEVAAPAEEKPEE